MTNPSKEDVERIRHWSRHSLDFRVNADLRTGMRECQTLLAYIDSLEGTKPTEAELREVLARKLTEAGFVSLARAVRKADRSIFGKLEREEAALAAMREVAAPRDTPVMTRVPSAYEYQLATVVTAGSGGTRYSGWQWMLSRNKPHAHKNAIRNLRPLYTLAAFPTGETK